MDDATKKQRVEDWDQILFVKKDDAQEEQNQRNALVPEDKQMGDGGEEHDVFNLFQNVMSEEDVESLYHQANATGQDHRGYQSFTLDWSISDPDPMPVDGKNPFGGVGGSSFDGHSPAGMMQL